MSIEKINKKYSILKTIEKRSNFLCKNNYKKYFHSNYNILIIESIMSNGKCRAVAEFKDYLIKEDNYEYLRRFYKYSEIIIRLKRLCNYHNSTAMIFPNYFPLIESKYLYNNVIKKQRIIDEQQDNEDKKLKNKTKKGEKIDKLFSNTIYDDIINSSESVLRIVFGIEKNKYNLKNIQGRLNDLYKIKNDNEYINKDSSDLEELIKQIEKAENNKNFNKKFDQNSDDNTLSGNKNKKIKSKLKLMTKNLNNNQIENRNLDLLNNITNNSTNITNSSNNIRSNITIQNNKSKNKMDNKFTIDNKFKFSSNIINSIKKSKEIINKNNNFPKPYQTLYGLNFILKNPLINNIINVDIRDKYNNNNSNKINLNQFKNLVKKSSFINTIEKIKSNTKKNKTNNSQKKIPSIDLSKLNTINNNMLTLTTRNKRKSYNERIKRVFNTENKSYRKKNKILIRNVINSPTLSLSPLNKKLKNIYSNDNCKNNANNKNFKSMSFKKNNNQYLYTNNFKNKKEKLSIKDYNFKNNAYININLYNNEKYIYKK